MSCSGSFRSQFMRSTKGAKFRVTLSAISPWYPGCGPRRAATGTGASSGHIGGSVSVRLLDSKGGREVRRAGSARDLKLRGTRLLSHGPARYIYRSSSEYSSLSLNMAICSEAIQIHAQLYRLSNAV